MKAHKQYQYTRGEHAAWDAEFSTAAEYGKIRMGEQVLFWKEGLHWYVVELVRVQRFYRQVENVYGRLCCGGRSYVIQRLIAVLEDGTELKMHIGDDAAQEAETLLETLKSKHPGAAYGKA